MPYKWDREGYVKKLMGRERRGIQDRRIPPFSSSCPGGKDKSPLSCPQAWIHAPELIILFFM